MFSASHTKTVTDLRSGPRAVFHRRARLTDATNAEAIVKTLDIGEEGCGFLIQQPLKENQHCTLTISVNCDGKPMEITANGTIVYCMLSGTRGYRAGLHFTNIDSQSKALIKRVIERSAKRM